MSDDWFRDAVGGHTAPPRPGFRGELRETLSDEWHGRASVVATSDERRRPWWTIGAAAAAVVALVVSGLVWAVRRGDDGTVIAPPPDTAAPTTAAPTMPTTTPPGTTTPPVEPPAAFAGTTLAGWLTGLGVGGLADVVLTVGDATDAILASVFTEAASQTAIVLDRDHAIPLPPDLGTIVGPLLGIGSQVAVVTMSEGGPVLQLFDPATGAHTGSHPLGFGTDTAGGLQLGIVDDHLLASHQAWVPPADGEMWTLGARSGVRISPDLTSAVVAQPPTMVPMTWTTIAGGKALLLGLDIGDGSTPPLDSPWAYDPATDVWTEIADPEWLPCDAAVACVWTRPHEYGDPDLEIATPHGVVVRMADDSIGLLDPASLTWRRLDTAPFRSDVSPLGLTNRKHYLVGDNWIVSMPYAAGTAEDPPVIGVLDVSQGSWNTFDLPGGVVPAGWESKQLDGSLVLAPYTSGPAGRALAEPFVAVDGTTGEVRPAGEADVAGWHHVLASPDGSSYTVDGLLALVGGAAPPTVKPTAPPACADALNASGAVAALLDARRSGGSDAQPSCVTVTEASLLSGVAPFCWEECAPRAFAEERVNGAVDGSWHISLPVSYAVADGYRDVVESWELGQGPRGWEAALTSVGPPVPERGLSLDAINTYLAAIDAGDWLAAAGMLSDGAADLPDRHDLLQMGVTDFTDMAVAGALEAWCRAECDTSPVDDAELVFNGGYAVRRGDQTIRATWFEGVYSVGGAPFRPAALTGAEALAGWPAPPPADLGLLDTLPYLLPTADLSEVTAYQYSPATEAPPPYLYPRFTQVWFDGDGSRALIVTTAANLPPTTDPQFRVPVDVTGWDAAFVTPGTSPFLQNLTLGTASGSVSVRGIGFAEAEVVAIANALEPRPAMWAGWNIADLPDTMILFAEGWDQSSVGGHVWWERGDGVVVGELTISHGGAELATTDQLAPDARELIRIGGAPAVVTATGGRLVAVWPPVPGVTARFGWYGPRAEFDAILASLESVDRTTWEAYGVPPDPGRDGCMSMFC